MIVISDGKIIEKALEVCNLRKEWLNGTLEKNNLRPQDIFLMSCDRRANYTIVIKDGVDETKGGESE